jgi:hypothetical protein
MKSTSKAPSNMLCWRCIAPGPARWQANQIRGLLGEFGIVLPQGITHLRGQLPEILEDGDNGLPGLMVRC